MLLEKFSQFQIDDADLKKIKGGKIYCTINDEHFLCASDGSLLDCTIACDAIGNCGGCGEVMS